MKSILASNLKVKFLGVTPVLKDETGILNPQQIVALSALLTFKGKSIRNLLKESIKKGENLEKKIQGILRKSSLRGHASIVTTPTLCLTYEGSKFLDSALTGIVFSSSLTTSGRRNQISENDIVFPDRIFLNKKARAIYQVNSGRNIKFLNSLLSRGIQRDEASKILQYGHYGTVIIQLPIESIVGLKREYLAEKEWMPEEVGILLKEIEKKSANLGIDWLYATREAAPRNVYPYPNIFKDPHKSNLVRELLKKEKLDNGSKLISMDTLISPGLKEKLINLRKKIKDASTSLNRVKKEWLNLLFLRQEILRDYNLALRFKVLSSVPWRVWGEKKRHRTCPQIIESIYYCIEKAAQKFDKFKNQIESRKINTRIIKEIEKVFSIPPSIKKNNELLVDYFFTALKSFQAYQKLIELKIKPREAIFLIPRAVKIDVLQEYDLYNLLTGYYPLRLCQTAEEEMRRNTLREVVQIKKALSSKGYNWLNEIIGPKCEIVGFCPEEKSCGRIKSLVKNYNDEFHQQMKEELEIRFQQNLKNLGK